MSKVVNGSVQNRRTARCFHTIRDERDISLLERNDYRDLVTSQSIYDVFRTTALLHGDRPALTVLPSASPDTVAATCSHGELLAEITRAANMLGRLGVRRGGVVTLLTRTHARVPALIWGAQTAGVASCINYLLAPEVIAALLEAEGARVLVCPGPALDAELWAKACEVVALAPGIEAVLVMGGLPAGMDGRYRDADALMDAQPHDRLVDVVEPGLDDMAALFHTGGTTGLPKLVPQSHRNQIHAAWSLAQLFDLSETDIALNGFPLFHVGGTSTLGMSLLAAGGHVVFLSPSGFREPGIVAGIWRLVERFRATVLGGVPTAIGSMSEVPVEDSDLSSLRFAMTGGSSLPRAVAERFEERTGLPLLEQYGMTETVAALATTPLHGRHLRGSVGLRCPFSTIGIVKPGTAGGWEACAAGEVGVVTVGGPQVFAGYLDPHHNAGAFTPDGAFVTGDLGYLDAQGYLHLTGREKDLIIRSGHNIDPLAIEEIANAHPEVSLSAAVGMPDEYAGEVPVIFVSPASGVRLAAEDVRAYVHARIQEPPARPRHVFLLEEIPVTGVGKIFKPALRALAVKHKLQMLVAALDGPLEILDISSPDDGGQTFVVTLAASRAMDRARVGRDLDAALAELPIEVAVEWLEQSAEGEADLV